MASNIDEEQQHTSLLLHEDAQKNVMEKPVEPDRISYENEINNEGGSTTEDGSETESPKELEEKAQQEEKAQNEKLVM